MDHDEILRGGSALDRQERPLRDAASSGRPRDARGRPILPSRVPEMRPTPLQDGFIYLSIVVLVCGVIAISALELGTPLAAPIVKLPVLVGGAVLAALIVDATVRIWRSAWAWMPVDRGRGLFRLVWVATLAAALALLAVIAWLVVTA